MSENVAAVAAPAETHTSQPSPGVATPGLPTANPSVPPPSTDGTAATPRFSVRDYERSLNPGAQRLSAAAVDAAAGGAPASQAPAEAPTGPKADATGRLHGENGQFVEKPAASGEAASVEAPAAPVEPQGDGSDPKAAPTEPPALVRIEVPEGDIRRAVGGLDAIEVPPAAEQAVRWALKNHVRAAEVENLRTEAQRQIQQEQERAVELAARLEVLETRYREALTSPDASLRDWYLDNLQNYGEERANLLLRAVMSEQDTAVQERMQSYRQQQMEQVAVQAEAGFRNEAIEAVRQQVPWWAEGSPNAAAVFDRAWREYSEDVGAAIQQGRSVTPTVEQFIADYLRPRFATDPYTLSYLQQQNEAGEAQRQKDAAEAEAKRQAAIQAAAEEKARKDAEQAALLARTNPMGNVSSAQVYRGNGVPAEKFNARSFDRVMSRR